jgi:hypothetical protein
LFRHRTKPFIRRSIRAIQASNAFNRVLHAAPPADSGSSRLGSLQILFRALLHRQGN